jgi:hypothetical protein
MIPLQTLLLEDSDEEVYEVNKIINYRKDLITGATEYYCTWKGYKDRTWEKVEDLQVTPHVFTHRLTTTSLTGCTGCGARLPRQARQWGAVVVEESWWA